MGLKLTLPKTDNAIGIDFVDAYWSIEDITFMPNSIEQKMYVSFKLVTFPSRECKYLNGTDVPNTVIPYGTSDSPKYRTTLHVWSELMPASDVFPSGIPLSTDEQKAVLYEFVKTYTGLPFEDVFEGEADE